MQIQDKTINYEIFKIIKNKEFDRLYNLIKKKELTNLDIRDEGSNYFIHYIVNYNQLNIMELILEMVAGNIINVRLDVLDTDKRSILYYCIKFNYDDMIKLLLEYNNNTIGISIFDIKDNLGLTALHYCVIFNNKIAFELLIEYGANPYTFCNDGSNAFIYAILYNRNEIFNYLIDKKYDLDFVTKSGDTLLQVAVSHNNTYIIEKLLSQKINLNNVNHDYGMTILHMSVILNNFNLFKKLMDKDIKYNLADFSGNTTLHYIVIDKKIKYLNIILKHQDIKFNITNIDGNIPLHILLDYNNFNDIEESLINKFILESDLNIQNNQGITCLMKIVNNNLLNKFKNLLILKPLNFFIENNNCTKIEITDDILDILVQSYYNQIKINKSELLDDWEKWCAIDDYIKLKTIVKNNKNNLNPEKICKEKIRELIIKEKRSIPKLFNIDIKFDTGIFVNNCYYTGSPIDILFGLILLNKEFRKKKLHIILDFPLTINMNLENYYKKLGLDYPLKLDFSNIEILWSYQKLFFPSYFNIELQKNMQTSKFITIPIGIETTFGSHANILFWDIQNKTLERFEPNGSNYPYGLNYNPNLLDSLIENKFKQFDENIKYYPPSAFLPTIGFQLLESAETTTCKRIGDPNGFCGVWCIWWIYQRMININNPKISITNIADILIKHIKYDNQSFKKVIRNFSKKITDIRDAYLNEYKLDINDWIVGKYTEDILDKLEKKILEDIKL